MVIIFVLVAKIALIANTFTRWQHNDRPVAKHSAYNQRVVLPNTEVGDHCLAHWATSPLPQSFTETKH